MILADSTVLIDYSRSAVPKLKGLLSNLPIAVAGPIRAEVLAGARTPKHRFKLLNMLDGFLQVPSFEGLRDSAGDNAAALRRAGVNVPFQDVLIATLAIDADVELWTRDNHFSLIQGVLPALRLFSEPP